MKSYDINTYYSSGSYSFKTRHAINTKDIIELVLKEDCHINKAKVITLTWKKVGCSQEQVCNGGNSVML